MTYREKLMKEHPECVSDSFDGGCAGCPYEFGYERKEDSFCLLPGDSVCTPDECADCWGREAPETMSEHISYVRQTLDYRTKLEALAEEASELAQAALKLIRALELSGNTTPVPGNDAELALIEEIMDVASVIHLLGYGDALKRIEHYYKWRRWAHRLGYEENANDRD